MSFAMNLCRSLKLLPRKNLGETRFDRLAPVLEVGGLVGKEEVGLEAMI
jgi:hypothetical protein